MRAGITTLTAIAVLAAPAAIAAEGAWGEGTKASARVLAAGLDEGGHLIAGIEIVMPSGWHTYWRTPGDAGIPPVFDFTGSTNLGPVAVAFPVPTRYDDGVSVTNVYRDRVVLPLIVEVEDTTAPSTLVVRIDLGVCAEICVPDTVTATLTVPARENDGRARRRIREAVALVPSPAEPGVFAVEDIAREGGTDERPVFRFSAVVPDSTDAEIFLEGPENWAAYRPERATDAEGAVAWTVKFSRLGAEAGPGGASFRVTLVSAGRAIEQTVTAE